MKGTVKIFSDGAHTLLELGGKTFGPGVTRVAFDHDGKDVHLSLDINAKDFAFLPDGRFDEVAIDQKKNASSPDMVVNGQHENGFYIG